MASLTFDIFGRDRGAGRALDSVGAKASKTSREFSKFKALAAGAALAVGAALFKFGKDSVRQFIEAEKAQNQLSDAFSRFPKLADISIDSLRSYNQELAKKTRFDDDAFASGQAILAQFGLTGRQLKDLTPLLADYAAKTGRDLPEAAKLLGKASLGNTRALKDLGVNYKVTGDQATDFANITDLVRARVGGFAEKEGKTAAGQLAILQNQFGELQEEVGARLLPALLGLTRTGLKLVEWIDRNKDTLGPLVKLFGSFAVAILLVNRAAKAYTVTQAAMTVALGKYGKEAGVAAKATKTLGLALVGLTAFTIIHDLFNQSAQELGRFTDQVEALGGQNINQRIAAITAELEKQNEAAKEGVVIGVSGLLQWYTSGKALEAADRVDALKARLAELNAEREREIRSNAAASLEIKKTMEAQIGAAGSADRYAHALGVTTGALQEQNQELEEAWENQNRLNNEVLNATEAEISYRDTLASGTQRILEAVKAHEKNATSLNKNTQAGRDNVSWILDAIKSANAHAEAKLKEAGSIEKANGALRNDVIALKRAAEAAGLNRDQVDALIKKYLKVPSKVETKVKATVSGLGALTTLSNIITTLNGVRVNIPVSALTARQHGGSVAPNRAYLVGEGGRPEILYNNRVYPGGRTPPMLTPANGVSDRTILEIRSGGSRFDDLLVESLSRSVRRRGGNVQLVLGGRG